MLPQPPKDPKGPPRPIIQTLIFAAAILLWLVAALVLVFDVPILSPGAAQVALTVGGFALVGVVLYFQLFRGPRI